jgi:hypothetical protein
LISELEVSQKLSNFSLSFSRNFQKKFIKSSFWGDGDEEEFSRNLRELRRGGLVGPKVGQGGPGRG